MCYMFFVSSIHRIHKTLARFLKEINRLSNTMTEKGGGREQHSRNNRGYFCKMLLSVWIKTFDWVIKKEHAISLGMFCCLLRWTSASDFKGMDYLLNDVTFKTSLMNTELDYLVSSWMSYGHFDNDNQG